MTQATDPTIARALARRAPLSLALACNSAFAHVLEELARQWPSRAMCEAHAARALKASAELYALFRTTNAPLPAEIQAVVDDLRREAIAGDVAAGPATAATRSTIMERGAATLEAVTAARDEAIATLERLQAIALRFQAAGPADEGPALAELLQTVLGHSACPQPAAALAAAA